MFDRLVFALTWSIFQFVSLLSYSSYITIFPFLKRETNCLKEISFHPFIRWLILLMKIKDSNGSSEQQPVRSTVNTSLCLRGFISFPSSSST